MVIYVYIYFVILALAVILILWCKKRSASQHKEDKGEQGEAMLRQHTDLSLADKGYHALHDLLIPFSAHDRNTKLNLANAYQIKNEAID